MLISDIIIIIIYELYIWVKFNYSIIQTIAISEFLLKYYKKLY